MKLCHKSFVYFHGTDLEIGADSELHGLRAASLVHMQSPKATSFPHISFFRYALFSF